MQRSTDLDHTGCSACAASLPFGPARCFLPVDDEFFNFRSTARGTVARDEQPSRPIAGSVSPLRLLSFVDQHGTPRTMKCIANHRERDQGTRHSMAHDREDSASLTFTISSAADIHRRKSATLNAPVPKH